MDNLVKELVQVDKQARQRVSKAKKQRAVALEQLDREKSVVREENEAALAAFLEQEQIRHQLARDEALQKLEQDSARVIEKMDVMYEQNHDAWVQSVLDAVTV